MQGKKDSSGRAANPIEMNQKTVRDSASEKVPAEQRSWESFAPERAGPQWEKGKEGPLRVMNWGDPRQ